MRKVRGSGAKAQDITHARSLVYLVSTNKL